MTAQNFMNVVRFKLRSDCVDKYFAVIDKTSFEGMTQRYIAKTGDYVADELIEKGKKVHIIGGADVASELDAKRAIDQGVRLAISL